MTPKHKKHKIILKYIIINSVNSSDKEENLQSSQMRETSYIQRNKYKNDVRLLSRNLQTREKKFHVQ